MSPRADGPLEVLERINDNAYKVELPRECGVFNTFNMADLSPYLEDVPLKDLGSNPLQQGEANGDPSTKISSTKNIQAMVLKVM